MKSRNTILISSGLLFVLFLIAPPRAEAYIDPGNGSYLLQLLMAGLLGLLFTLKSFFRKCFSFLKSKRKEKPKNEPR